MRLVNGIFAESLSLADRSIQFGDGIFRTIKVMDGKPQFWSRQFAKLCADCQVLGIVPPAEALLLADIARLAPRDHALKIIISRGETARGYSVPDAIQPNRIVQISPLADVGRYQQGVTLRVCRTRASWQPGLAGIKHLNRLENVLARAEWNDPQIFDGLMLDRDGFVIEGVMSNVFVRLDDTWLTPALNESGVAGVYRALVIEAMQQLGIAVRVAPFTLDKLLSADAVMVCNSLVGLLPVIALEQQRWKIDAILTILQESINMLDCGN